MKVSGRRWAVIQGFDSTGLDRTTVVFQGGTAGSSECPACCAALGPAPMTLEGPGIMDEEWLSAAGRGDVATVLDHLGRGMDVNASDRFGRTALGAAVMGRQIEMIRTLLERNADPNRPDGCGHTPMTEAVVVSQAWAVPEPDDRPLGMLKAAVGRLGLREAVLMGDVGLARELCEQDPRLDVSGDAQYWYHDTVLMVAARRGYREMVGFLLDRGADIEGTDDLGATALMRAADSGDVEMVALLLDRGADVNHDDWSDQTPLSEAAVGGHKDAVDLLIARGASRGLLDAVALDDPALVADLLARGADPDHLYYGCGRLVMYAVGRGHEEIVRSLLNHGASHLHPTFDEHSLVAEAAKRGYRRLVEVLIAHGADALEVGEDGLSALDWAEKAGHPTIADVLRRMR